MCNELNAIENFNCYGISHHDVLFDEEREEDEADQFVPPPTPQQKERNVEETLLGLENQENKKILVTQNNGKKKKHKNKKKEKKKFAYLFDEEAEEDDEEENNIDNMKSTLEDLESIILKMLMIMIMMKFIERFYIWQMKLEWCNICVDYVKYCVCMCVRERIYTQN